jgi:hypothetical protein
MRSNAQACVRRLHGAGGGLASVTFSIESPVGAALGLATIEIERIFVGAASAIASAINPP